MADANDPYAVTADELRQFIERFEQLDSEKKDVAEQQKELMAEAKGRGYDTRVMRKVIAMRKRKPATATRIRRPRPRRFPHRPRRTPRSRKPPTANARRAMANAASAVTATAAANAPSAVNVRNARSAPKAVAASVPRVAKAPPRPCQWPTLPTPHRCPPCPTWT